jgi:hypothetical protein
MATNYPTSLDAFTNPTSTDLLTSPSHSQQHSDINDAVEALEAKVAIGNTVLGTYTSYTPTYPSGLTVGNATVSAQYCRVNNFVHYWGRVLWGTTTSINTSGLQVSLPITADTTFSTGAVNTIGTAGLRNNTTSNSFFLVPFMVNGTATAMNITAQLASGTYVSVSAITTTAPFTQITGDSFWWNVYYKAA